MKTQARHRQKWDKYLLTYSAKQEMEDGQFQIALPRGWMEGETAHFTLQTYL